MSNKIKLKNKKNILPQVPSITFHEDRFSKVHPRIGHEGP